jgi:hypothetical protein
MYDAVPSVEVPTPMAQPSAGPVDEEMESFLPLLRDYLKVTDAELTVPAPTLARVHSREQSSTRIGEEDEEDYVWDVFYYRPTLSEWNAVAGGNIGSLCVLLLTLCLTHNNMVSSTGLPPSVNNPDESDSESEPEDEDDEDSNGGRS